MSLTTTALIRAMEFLHVGIMFGDKVHLNFSTTCDVHAPCFVRRQHQQHQLLLGAWHEYLQPGERLLQRLHPLCVQRGCCLVRSTGHHDMRRDRQVHHGHVRLCVTSDPSPNRR